MHASLKMPFSFAWSAGMERLNQTHQPAMNLEDHAVVTPNREGISEITLTGGGVENLAADHDR